MFQQIKKFTLQMMAGANIGTLLIMLLVGYSGRLNPVSHALLSNINFTFPVFLILNLAFLIFWVIFKPKYILLPVVGFILAYQPVRAYIPLNVPSQVPEGAIKILSYNVWCFADWKDQGRENPIIQYLASQKADIVCLQEASCTEKTQADLKRVMGEIYEYSDTSCIRKDEDILAIYSRFPIVHKEKIVYKSAGNHSAAFTLNVHGKKVVVLNNHLESMGLSFTDKENFKRMLKGEVGRDSAKYQSYRLIDKLSAAAKIRAPQAEAVRQFIKKHNYQSILCVGDFNDSPLSYTHGTIAEGLTDCYIASGNGPGISYHSSGFYVRIDNILCSDDWKPVRCTVDDKIAVSDHYPIYCWLKSEPEKRER